MKCAFYHLPFLHNLIFAHSLATVKKACFLPSSIYSSNPPNKLVICCCITNHLKNYCLQGTTDHLALLIILRVAWALLGYSSAPGLLVVARVMQRFSWAEALRWLTHVAGRWCRTSSGNQCDLLMEDLSSFNRASPHDLSFSQHRGWAPRGEEVNGRFLKTRPQKLCGVTSVTLLCSK